YGPQNDVTLKMPAFEWVHVQLHQQKGMISLSPPTICNSAASRLAHYNGGASLSFRYLDHKTGETATETLTQRELVARLKQHIPEKFFKMVRYFGFLANRVCGEKLPQVYRALGMDKPEPVAKVCYAQMVKQFLSRDPFECVLCGCRMVYRRAIAGLNVSGLKKNARDISLLRYMPA
ncbi:transposase, partial [Klebsiella pneumoniae]